LGLKASPANGWWFNLNAGYQIREDDLFWKLGDVGRSYVSFLQGKSNVFYGNAELKYDYKDLFDLALQATYYNWDSKSSDEYEQKWVLALKPELEINAEVGFKPMFLRILGNCTTARCNSLVNNQQVIACIGELECTCYLLRFRE